MTAFGPLTPADETFTHQIPQTFATVAQSDRSWTEKVCAMATPRDGAFQLAFGMGKYPNRGVLDAYAGVSRGVEQWTVRSSRRPSRLRCCSWSSRAGGTAPVNVHSNETGTTSLGAREKRTDRSGSSTS